MSVFKRLGGGDHVVEPFQAYASQSLAWTSGSSAIPGFSVNLALKPPLGYPDGAMADDGLGGTTIGGFSSYPLYQSVKSHFYIPSSSLAVFNEYDPTDNIFVINTGANYVGDGIYPTSFRFDINGVSNFVSDNGTGVLKLNGTGSILGNVFYEHGLAVITQNSTPISASITSDGVSIVNGSVTSTTFQSTVTIYEHTVVCTINPFDYRNSMNPTAFITGSDSVSFNDYINIGDELPYITTIGLYNEFNELLATAKISQPLTRQRFTDQTFIIKFDE